MNCIAIDPGVQAGEDPRWVASGCGGGFLFVWDPRKWDTPVATLRGESAEGITEEASRRFTPSSAESGLSKGGGGSGRWEGETVGATMLKSVNCLSGGDGGEWLFAAGETVVRAWKRSGGNWAGGFELPGEGFGAVASLTSLD